MITINDLMDYVEFDKSKLLELAKRFIGPYDNHEELSAVFVDNGIIPSEPYILEAASYCHLFRELLTNGIHYRGGLLKLERQVDSSFRFNVQGNPVYDSIPSITLDF